MSFCASQMSPWELSTAAPERLPLAMHNSAVVELAVHRGLTTYDASYLHLSQSLGISLVTFDEQLRSAVSAPR